MNDKLMEPQKATAQILKCADSICAKKVREMAVPFAVSDIMRETLSLFHEQMNELQKTMISGIQETLQRLAQVNLQFTHKYKKTFDRLLFFEIAKETGFPIYLECDTELQDMLVESYRANGNSCNINEMQQIIFEYYDEEYVNSVCRSFANSNIFNKERVGLLKQGIAVYQLHYFAAANSLFAAQMGGMIRDLYAGLSKTRKFTQSEKNKVRRAFKLGNCRDDSEKLMLAEVISEQEGGIMIWCHVARFFLKYIYSSGEGYMEEYPKRHMICHGIQTNYDTRKMSLKLILCIDILTELAFRVGKMKETAQQVIIDI